MSQVQKDLGSAIGIVAVLALLAWLMVMNPTPWSPMGEAEQQRKEQSDPSFQPNESGSITPRAPARQT